MRIRLLTLAILASAVFGAAPAGSHDLTQATLVLVQAMEVNIETGAYSSEGHGRLIGPWEGDPSNNGYTCIGSGTYDGDASIGSFAGTLECRLTEPLQGMRPDLITAPIAGTQVAGQSAWGGAVEPGRHRLACRGMLVPDGTTTTAKLVLVGAEVCALL